MSDTSIRTPAWGVTGDNHPRGMGIYFNSHPRVGGDHKTNQDIAENTISIRTPAWGVTTRTSVTIADVLFQFAPPRGG